MKNPSIRAQIRGQIDPGVKRPFYESTTVRNENRHGKNLQVLFELFPKSVDVWGTRKPNIMSQNKCTQYTEF